MPTATSPNSIGVTLGLVGDQWNLLLVQQAILGKRRYGDFMEALPISHAVLTTRLSGLVEAGIFEKDEGYVLTEAGLDLWRVLLSIWAWEQQWPRERAALPDMRHVSCGEIFCPQLCCQACGGAVAVDDLDKKWGPLGSWEGSVPVSSTRRQRGPSPVDVGLFPDTLSLVGNRWALALLGACLMGLTRFSEFEAALQAPPTVISDRLRTFVEVGALARDEAARSYHLTEKGWAMTPTVVLALDWGERWHGRPEGSALDVRHRVCGATFDPELRCDRCGGTLVLADVTLT